MSFLHQPRTKKILATASPIAIIETLATTAILTTTSVLATISIFQALDKYVLPGEGMGGVLRTILVHLATFNHYMAKEVVVRREIPQWDMIPATALGGILAVGAMR